MKSILITLFASVATLLSYSQPSAYIGDAAIEVNEIIYDFGEITQTADGEYTFCEFTVTNIGSEPLVISKCKGSCGCTTPQCSTTPIKSGDDAVIKVRYDSNRMGPFTKKVTIYSNATNEPEKVVTVKGTVIAK